MPQDLLLPLIDRESTEAAMRRCIDDPRGNPRCIIGVAGRAPVDADISQLEQGIDLLT